MSGTAHALLIGPFVQIIKSYLLLIGFILPAVVAAEAPPADLSRRMIEIAARLPDLFYYNVIYHPRRAEIVVEPRCVSSGLSSTFRSHAFMQIRYYFGVFTFRYIELELPGVTELASGRERSVGLSLRFVPHSYKWEGFIRRATPEGPFDLPISLPSCSRYDKTNFLVLGTRALIPLETWAAARD